jgi:GNAT superfamily N-acetyltransferase
MESRKENEPFEINVRQLRERDLSAADRIFRLAFGTFFGLEDPLKFCADQDYVRTRWLAEPAAAFGAEVGGELVGSNFATSWGSVGFFGPITIRPDFWDRGIAKRLLETTMPFFERSDTKHLGLFTIAHSAKHIGLYQKFGFWPRFLTAIMSKQVEQKENRSKWSTFSSLQTNEREACLRTCRELTDVVYGGLDVTREINAVDTHKLGDTVLLWDDLKLVGLAVCHCGIGTEAGNGVCYVKFGVARPGPNVSKHFERLLDACEGLAIAKGMSSIVAGVNMARHDAYRKMIMRDFRTEMQGVAMQKPNEPGYNTPEVYLIDDWR